MNICGPTVEFFRISLPLDKVLQFAVTPSRLENFLHNVYVVHLFHHLLKLILITFSFCFFSKQVVKSRSHRTGRVASSNRKNFIGPILQVAFFEDVFIIASHIITNLKFLMRCSFYRIHSIYNFLSVFSRHFVRCHYDCSMKRFII